MGDVNCFVCERVLSQHKFVFKCRICQRDFDDVAQVLEHYSDTNYEYLKCEGSHSSSFNVAAVKKEEPEVAISDEPPFEPIQELLDNNDLDLADWDDSLELKWSGSDKKRKCFMKAVNLFFKSSLQDRRRCQDAKCVGRFSKLLIYCTNTKRSKSNVQTVVISIDTRTKRVTLTLNTRKIGTANLAT